MPRFAGADVGDEEVFFERSAFRHHLAVGVGEHGPSVEDDLILAADEVAVGDGGFEFLRALGEDFLSLGDLADVERRCGDIEQQIEVIEGSQECGDVVHVPHVEADRHCDFASGDLECHRSDSGFEISSLVEDSVVRQCALCVDVIDLAVAKYCRGVSACVGKWLGESDDDSQGGASLGELLDQGEIVLEKVSLEDEVFGWIAADRLFGKDEQVDVGFECPVVDFEHLVEVAVEVSNGDVNLCQCDSHCSRIHFAGLC